MEVKHIILDYEPRKWARELHEAATRWMMLVLHRRAGKTTGVINHLQRDCLRISDSQFGYIAPTYKQAKRIVWDMAKKAAIGIPDVQTNESELTIRYPNGSKLTLFGADNPDSLRGIALWGVGFDEFPLQPSRIFSEIVSKCLADHLGYAIFFGTPKGKNEFYRMYLNALSNKEWTVIFKTIDDSLKDEKGETIENLRVALEDDRKLVEQGMMTIDEFNQEWYCSFDAGIKGSVYGDEIAKAREEKRIGKVPYESGLPVDTVWDLGMGDSMSIGFFQTFGTQERMIDYYENSGQGLEHYVKVLQDKKYVYGKHYAPHDIMVRELGTGVSRFETAKGLGITFETRIANTVKNGVTTTKVKSALPSISIQEGIDQTKLLWNRIWIDEEKCGVFIETISQYHREFNEKMKEYSLEPVHDWSSHAADMFRYKAIVPRIKQQTQYNYYAPKAERF